MERARYEGGAKLPPCSMAKLTIKVFGGAKGDTTVTHRLYLPYQDPGSAGAFFESIGQCKRGETFRPRWNEVVGAKGICKLASGSTPNRAALTPVRPARATRCSASCRPPAPKAAPSQAGRRGHSDGAGTETLPAAGP